MIALLIALAVLLGFALGWWRAHRELDGEWIEIADAWAELVGVLEGGERG